MWWYDIETNESSEDDNGTEAEIAGSIESILDSFYLTVPAITDGIKRGRVTAICHKLLTFQNPLGTTGILYDYGGEGVDGDWEALYGGADCSGSTGTIAVACNLITEEWFKDHRTASAMKNACKVIDISEVKPGDFSTHNNGGHVAIVCYVNDGIPWIMSMSGGGETTHSNNPNARAKLVRYDYWAFHDFRRFPA